MVQQGRGGAVSTGFPKWIIVLAAAVLFFSACAQAPLIGMAYTHVRLPLTRDLQAAKMPERRSSNQKIIEIREPITGMGFYARVDSNAIGDIAKVNGIKTLYFADQEIFSVLGVYKTVRVHLYGEE